MLLLALQYKLISEKEVESHLVLQVLIYCYKALLVIGTLYIGY